MVDVLITSSSRPQLWPFFWKSYQKYLIHRKEHKYWIHEDMVFPEESEKVFNFIEQNITCEKGVRSSNPSIGLGRAMDKMFKQIDSKYILYLQEDWEFERPVDIDRLEWVMDENPEINCIFLNKYKNFKKMNGIEQPYHPYSDVDMCLYHSWTFLPGIWRMNHVKKYWRVREIRPEGYFTNAFGTHEQRSDHDYARDFLGVYMLGKQLEPRYVRHLGNDWRMASWRLKDGKPGGAHDTGELDLPYRAPWLPEIEDRPMRMSEYTKDEIMELISEEPEEARNARE